MAKQQNKQNVQGAQQQAYTSETNVASQSVIEEQISDTVAEGTIDVKLGKESQEKRKKRESCISSFSWKSVDFQNYNQIPWFYMWISYNEI